MRNIAGMFSLDQLNKTSVIWALRKELMDTSGVDRVLRGS